MRWRFVPVSALLRSVLLSALLFGAGCGSGAPTAGASETPDDGLPQRIGAEDCGGCRLSRGQCSAYFAVDSEGAEQAEGKEIPCDASCCEGPALD
jgi:hypothetical protein